MVEGLVTSLVGRRTTAMARRSSFRVQHLDERIPVSLGGVSHEPLPDADSDECRRLKLRLLARFAALMKSHSSPKPAHSSATDSRLATSTGATSNSRCSG